MYIYFLFTKTFFETVQLSFSVSPTVEPVRSEIKVQLGRPQKLADSLCACVALAGRAGADESATKCHYINKDKASEHRGIQIQIIESKFLI